MTYDGVPWAVGGGARHSSEVARVLAFLSTGGMQGVVAATDMRVLALSVPGQAVRVMPGACVIRNARSSNESYIARVVTEDVVATNPTSAGAGRSDLVVANVENPTISGEPWGAAASLQDGPYIHTRVIENVSPTTKSVQQLGAPYNAWSAITLARIDYPSSTGTVTQAMVVDLRALANPVTGPEPAPDAEGTNEAETKFFFTALRSTGNENAGQQLSYTQTSFAAFPTAANWAVTVPSWATHVDVDVTVTGVQVNTADAYGEFRLVVNNAEAIKMVFDLNKAGTTPQRDVMGLGGIYQVPPGIRGKTIGMRLEARYFPSVARCMSSFLRANESTYTRVQLNFKQKPSLT